MKARSIQSYHDIGLEVADKNTPEKLNFPITASDTVIILIGDQNKEARR